MTFSPNLVAQPGSPLTFPWAEFITRTGVSPNGAFLRWGDADASITLQFDYDDVAAQPLLSSVPTQVLGYAERVPASTGNDNVTAITGATNASPIVLTTSVWNVQPAVGQVVIVRGINGNTAANGAWVVQDSSATTVTLANSTGNGAFVASPASSVQIAGGSIHRVLPLRHPFWTQLWCTSISRVTFYGPDGKAFPATGFGPYERWRTCHMELHFQSLDYALLTDAQLQASHGGNEFYRYVSGPYIDYNLIGLQRQPGVGTGFMWGPDAPGGLFGKPITQGVTQWLPVCDINYTWQLVPQDSLLDSNGFAANLFTCLSKVNSTPWLDYPAGTLLMHKPSVQPVPSPFPLNNDLTQPQRLWQAKIRLSYNPTGWNKVPTPLGGFASIFTSDGQPLYQSVNFNTYLFVSL